MQEWVQGPGSWIVAIGILETGINIENIVYIVHVDWLYRLTRFVQQSRHRERNREVSDLVIITRVENSYRQKHYSIISKYSVKQIDKDAITEFIQAQTCRRQVLGQYFDQSIDIVDCHSTNNIFCNWYKSSNRTREAAVGLAETKTEAEAEAETGEGEEDIQK